MPFWQRGKREQDLDRELRNHLDLEAAEQEERGLSGDDARHAAQRALGNSGLVREDVREAWGWTWLEQFLRDLQFGLRTMRKNPGFTIVVVLSLALGIGANTAVFSLLDTILLRNLPVEDPQHLVFLDVAGVQGRQGSPPYPCFERFRAQSRSFDAMSAFVSEDEKVALNGQVEKVNSQYASGNYFDLLGVRPALGRLLNSGDERLQPPVAVIGYGYWQRRFGGNPSVLGQVIRIGNQNLTIVGVSAAGFTGLDPGRAVEVTLPLTLQPSDALHNSGMWFLEFVARLKPGVSSLSAQAEIDQIFQGFRADIRMHDPFFDHMEVSPAGKGMGRLRSQFERPLLIAMAIVALVLLIGCANVGNLLLARAAARRREFAVRLALGSGRARLVRQLMTEIALLFSSGALLSLLVARWLARSLAGYLAVGRSPLIVESRLDFRVLAFAAALAFFTALLFGLLPALSASFTDSFPALQEGTRASASRSASRGRQMFVVSQVALSVVLLLGAGLFVETLSNLKSLDLGFRADGVVTLSLEPPGAESAVWSRILDQIRSVPGVQSASLSAMTPLSGRNRGVGVIVPGFQPHSSADGEIAQNHVSDGYFETLGIPLVTGRGFTNSDDVNSARVAVLNETAASFYFGKRSPLGVKLDFGKNGSGDTLPREVIGVVRDTKHNSLRKTAPRLVYLPILQPRDRLTRLTLTVRTSGNPGVLLRTIHDKVAGINPAILMTEPLTLRDYIDASLVQERLMSMLSSFFGVLALLLCAIGLYGILAHTVYERTHEIGIRMALGAPEKSVAWMVLRQSLGLVLAGIAIGLPLAFFAVRPIQALLYGLKPADPGIALLALAILLSIAALASYLPMRRAVRIDPVIALRHD